MALAASLSLLVGAALGVLGGGGSILMLPLLVYVVGLSPRDAIPLSLLIVGATSAAALAKHARSGSVCWRSGTLFGLAGMGGSYLGGRLSQLVPASGLLTGFALLRLATAVAMLSRRSDGASKRPAHFSLVLVMGAGVGVTSGLVGAGGGFLVVPALVMVGGLSMRRSVGTSLLVITMQAASGFVAHLSHARLDVHLAAVLVGAGVAGSLAGARWSLRLPQAKLRRAFGWLVLVLGAAMFVQQLGPLVSLSTSPVIGGGLIGLGASLLWLSQGRIAGISGVIGGLLTAKPPDRAWRALFLVGLLAGGALLARFAPAALETSPAPLALVVVAGLLVGAGTTLANGCTSGHGVCGLSRLSGRSLVATLVFMGAGFLTVSIVRSVFGGLS